MAPSTRPWSYRTPFHLKNQAILGRQVSCRCVQTFTPRRLPMVKIAACVAQVVGAVETFNQKEGIVEIFFQNLVAALGFVCFLPASKTDCESMTSLITHWHGRIFLTVLRIGPRLRMVCSLTMYKHLAAEGLSTFFV
eukprot:scaffold906_cov151-Amphora_coffeaeformis.AAC.7